MEQSAKFERFIYVMADLIEKYADRVDWDSLPDVNIPEKNLTSENASDIL
ncbi:hypothetical protein [Frisingicoccus sp.]